MAPASDIPDTPKVWGDVFGGLACLVGMIAAMSGFSLLFHGCMLLRAEPAFHEEGVVATPRIIVKNSAKVWVDEEGWKMNYWIEYEYHDMNGNGYQVKQHRRQDLWAKCSVGDALPDIEYVRSRPGTHRPVAQDGQWRSELRGGGILLGVGVVGLAVGWRLDPGRRSRGPKGPILPSDQAGSAIPERQEDVAS